MRGKLTFFSKFQLLVVVFIAAASIPAVAAPSVINPTTASSITSSGFSVRWLKSVDSDFSGTYYFDLATDNAFTNFVSGYNNKAVTSANITVTGLSPNTKYYYRLRVGGTDGNSANSNTVSATTLKVTATITLKNLSQVYDGTAKAAGDSTSVPGLAVTFKYNGSSTQPINAGAYSVVATIVDSTYMGTKSGTLTISPADGTVTLTNLTALYDGTAKSPTVVTSPAGLAVTFTYNDDTIMPTEVGSYDVVATINDPNSNSASDEETFNIFNCSIHLDDLIQTFDGTGMHDVSVATSPDGLWYDLTYNGHSDEGNVYPGKYFVEATINGDGYYCYVSDTMTIQRAQNHIAFGSTTVTYDGTPKPIGYSLGANMSSGDVTSVTYNGSSTSPTTAGTYTVVATIDGPFFYGSDTAIYTITKGTATVTLDSLNLTYDGSGKQVTVTTMPAGLATTVTYNGDSVLPVNAGAYSVVATVVDSNYQGSATGTLIISNCTITLGDLTQTYDGIAVQVTTSTLPEGLNVQVRYNGGGIEGNYIPGKFFVEATVNSDGYYAYVTDTMTLLKATTYVAFDNLTVPYNGSSQQPGVSPGDYVDPSEVTLTYDGSSTPPTNPGSYIVVGTIVDDYYEGSDTATFTITKATAVISIDSLSYTYDGAEKQVTISTTPEGLVTTVAYNGDTALPVNAGSYVVEATVVDSNYEGSITNTLKIAKAHAMVAVFSQTAFTYDGTSKEMDIYTMPAGLSVRMTYNGSDTVPTNAGKYAAVATVNDSNYEGSATDTLVIAKATATITFDSLSLNTPYTGHPRVVHYATEPTLLFPAVTYNGSSTAPTVAGKYAVVATINNANYEGTASDTLTITKATATVSLDDLAAVYDGHTKEVTATTTPEGLNVDITYNGESFISDAGSYVVVATVNDSNYTGSATDTLVIAKATASVSLSDLTAVYDSHTKTATAITTPEGLNVNITYNGESFVSDAGSYVVVATVNDSNYTGSATDTLVIAKATASISLSDLTAVYDSHTKAATAITTPEGLNVDITYNGEGFVSDAGSYVVVATVNDSNYTGSATDTLVIAKATATITFDSLSLNTPYTGHPRVVHYATEPTLLFPDVTYNGSSTAPTAAGKYAVVATINNANYEGTASDTLTITKATATVSLDDLAAVYDTHTKTVTAITTPEGLNVDITYNGESFVSDAGSYVVVATVNDSNYAGSATDTLVIEKADAVVSFTSIDLNVSFNDSVKTVGVTTEPGELNVTITYNDSTNAPTNAGKYVVTATVNDDNYKGTLTDTLTISKATATVTIDAGSLNPMYTGSANEASVVTEPADLDVEITYNGGTSIPVNAGTYIVVASVNDDNYIGTVTDTMLIRKGLPGILVSDNDVVYDGTPKAITITTNPAGLNYTVTYNDSLTPPVNAGAYIAKVTVADSNYARITSYMLTIEKATAVINMDSLSTVYDGSSKVITTTTIPAGLTVEVTYNDSTVSPVNAGKYAVSAAVIDSNYQAIISDSLLIAKATAGVSIANFSPVYDGLSKEVSVSTNPINLNVITTYDGSLSAPVNAGKYAILSIVDDVNYEGSTSDTLAISKATATISITNLTEIFDGDPKEVVVTTVPEGLNVAITYDGSSAEPSAIGTYSVVATVDDINYEGSDAESMTITFTTGIAEAAKDKVSIYPNPAAEYITVKAVSSPKLIKILDVAGACVFVKENCMKQETLDVRSLSKGMYYITVESSSGASTIPFVVK